MSHAFPYPPSMSPELDLGLAGGEGMVFLAAGAGGPGERRADGKGAQDDGAAINSLMEAPTPELSLPLSYCSPLFLP